MLIHKIFRTVKGKSKKDAFYGFLIQLLGQKPRKRELYALAFRHKSASLYIEGQKLNNERLEYLGDAVLGAIIADILFEKYPNQKEGFLTKLRSKIVGRKQLNQLGFLLGVQQFLVYHGTLAENVLGNCIEALVGAIYLDLGYEKTKKIISRQIIKKYVDFDALIKNDKNYKSKLVEWAQHEKKKLVFSTDETEKNGRPYFYTKVYLDDMPFGEGEGLSKKKSQQEASKETLSKINQSKEQ
ncbi:RNAse III [Balneicella halophila]|uniref:Ribonuclease 3 n=1 Tax=Balneicella halophila TaxID=1537566 RepID=A0A7L4US96_BALHA|nr:ribonuclease III [Balneicella halophila]PVX51824.1 RNAse III [Balneicella halophila]